MTTRRIISFNFILRIMCVALLLTSGSALMESCTKAGNCPDDKACNTLCNLFGFKDYGGFCVYYGTIDYCCCQYR
ncbi:hypothetical protein AAZX31_06G124800 [Glycine max]|uniref:Knottin scorpion toxin-like domain-containing protein n=1 Tax=Glycine max TaxID=3847 RepID=A0A0R0JGC0_SOYBN|nr:hypothetical protein JHK85_015536 [Glycine max]KAG5045772.1 hypothetical protein JHK86_015178 [Glycine max]KAG5148277.1 hypothetical protein JHK82_015158 [Glycine max]KAH1125642.1 hypothetical protein GYH30_014961 [Glycine max]KRH53530.1 hypothetical protein GLYMA_06G130600v4 [Glycine max]